MMLSRLFGQRDGVSAAVFDGVMRPNQDLDLCGLYGRDLGPVDDVTVIDGAPAVTIGNRIVRFSGHWYAPSQQVVATFDGDCGAVASCGDGGLAVALDGNRIVIKGGGHDGTIIKEAGGKALTCITALAVSGDRLLIAEGSQAHGPHEWRRDLLERNRTGRVVEVDLSTGNSKELATGLAWAGGVAIAGDGRIVVSESWAHRVVILGADGPAAGFDNIPAYPGRIAVRQGGGFWLCCPIARSQLVDFVLEDRRLCERMMRETEERFWIAPALASTDHPHEPVQYGGIKQFGSVKPWAPARSYGLVVQLDDDLTPIASLHSRVDGKRHGITGVAATDGGVFIVSAGHGKLLIHEETPE